MGLFLFLKLTQNLSFFVHDIIIFPRQLIELRVFLADLGFELIDLRFVDEALCGEFFLQILSAEVCLSELCEGVSNEH